MEKTKENLVARNRTKRSFNNKRSVNRARAFKNAHQNSASKSPVVKREREELLDPISGEVIKHKSTENTKSTKSHNLSFKRKKYEGVRNYSDRFGKYEQKKEKRFSS